MMGNGCRRKGDGAEETGKQVPKFPVSGHVVKNRMTVIFRKKMEGCLIWKIRELTSYLISAPFFFDKFIYTNKEEDAVWLFLKEPA